MNRHTFPKLGFTLIFLVITFGALFLRVNPAHAYSYTFSSGDCITFLYSPTSPSAGAPASFSWKSTTPIYWKCTTGNAGEWDYTYYGYRRLPTEIDNVTIDNYFNIDMSDIAPIIRGLRINTNVILNMVSNRIFIDTSTPYTNDETNNWQFNRDFYCYK